MKYLRDYIIIKSKKANMEIRDYLVISLILFAINFLTYIVGFKVIKFSKFFAAGMVSSFMDLIPVGGAGFLLLPMAVFQFIKKNFEIGNQVLLLYFIALSINSAARLYLIKEKPDWKSIIIFVVSFFSLFFSWSVRLGFALVLFLFLCVTVIMEMQKYHRIMKNRRSRKEIK